MKKLRGREISKSFTSRTSIILSVTPSLFSKVQTKITWPIVITNEELWARKAEQGDVEGVKENAKQSTALSALLGGTKLWIEARQRDMGQGTEREKMKKGE